MPVGACLHVYALLPESTKEAKLSLQCNFGPEDIYFFYAEKSLESHLFQTFPTQWPKECGLKKRNQQL